MTSQVDNGQQDVVPFPKEPLVSNPTGLMVHETPNNMEIQYVLSIDNIDFPLYNYPGTYPGESQIFVFNKDTVDKVGEICFTRSAFNQLRIFFEDKDESYYCIVTDETEYYMITDLEKIFNGDTYRKVQLQLASIIHKQSHEQYCKMYENLSEQIRIQKEIISHMSNEQQKLFDQISNAQYEKTVCEKELEFERNRRFVIIDNLHKLCEGEEHSELYREKKIRRRRH